MMVRTKADAYVKASVKAPRKNTVLRGESSKAATAKGGKSDKYAGGNSYCPRPTPTWQKPITSFFAKNGSADELNGKKEPMEVVSSCSNGGEQIPGCSKASELDLSFDKVAEEPVPLNSKTEKKLVSKTKVDDESVVETNMDEEKPGAKTTDVDEPLSNVSKDESVVEDNMEEEKPDSETTNLDEPRVNISKDEESDACDSTTD